MRLVLLPAVALLALGCGSAPVPPTPAPPVDPPESADHSHERGTMLLADAGPHHALLTAHLSKDGHELDIFFETTGKSPKPVALPLTSLTATVQVRAGAGEVKEIRFEPAPANERPKDEAADHYSHYVAKVPWLNPDAEHRVIVKAVIGGKEREVRWNEFVPRKYAHHTD